MTTVSRNDIRSFPIAQSSCEALIVMRMAGEHGVRPCPGSLACFINLCIHQWTAAMLAECRARICFNLRDIRRVMDGDDHCPANLSALTRLRPATRKFVCASVRYG